jgi:enoyl-CoA hydratase
MLADRLSAYTQFGQPLDAALATEFAGGMRALREGFEGAQRFAAGIGRHGESL